MKNFVVFGLLLGSCQKHFNGMLLKEPIEIRENFLLIDLDGKTINLKNALKNYNLIYFGYTRCPDVCHLVLKDISEALKYTKKNINVIFVSIDLKRDNPQDIKRYLNQFNGSFLGFIPKDENELYKISKFFSVGYEEDTLTGYIGHSAFIIFVKDSKIVEYFPVGLDPKDIASDINKF